MRYLPILVLLGMLTAFSAFATTPIYAAYLSDELTSQCQQNAPKACRLNVLNGEQLTELLLALPSSMLITDALSESEYEVLIGNAFVDINEPGQQATLVFEISTTWRNIPIDDLVLRQSTTLNSPYDAALQMLSQWAEHIEVQAILDAQQIYTVLGASNYVKQLQVPARIGEFLKTQSAIYRDPMLGSITRYAHPRFDSAVVDISVYPLFNTLPRLPKQSIEAGLRLEMDTEIVSMKKLIAQANIADFSVSSVSPASVIVDGQTLNGLSVEVQMHSKTDPTYTTQYIFQQHDKVIKLSANLPQYMMIELVNESVPSIKVPSESAFMRNMRKG
jgi:hypothetical protein